MIDNVFELEMDAPRPGVNDVTVNGVSVLTSGNVADIKAPEYDFEKHALTVGTRGAGDIGLYSVSEGSETVASGLMSHAEGRWATASGNFSHSEGIGSVASGDYSHAEGYETTASGDAAHSEGWHSSASGNNSHVEGDGTIANHRCQHVFGEFNTEDSSSNSNQARGNYIEIVGNGTNTYYRSNARTLDWNGNEWLAGGLTIGDNNLEVPTILSGTTEPISTDGRNNSLYVKYNDGDEVITPTIDNIYFKTNNTWIKDSFKDIIYVKTQTISIGKVQGNNYKTGTTPVSVEDGYIPIGIIGTQTTEDLIVGYIDIELVNTLYKICYKIFNPYSSASSDSTTLDVKVLYKKS